MSIIKVWYVERMKFLFDIIVHKKTKTKRSLRWMLLNLKLDLSFHLRVFDFVKITSTLIIYLEESAKFYSKLPCMFLAFSRNS